MGLNDNLHAAKRNKNDEFYTLYQDVENEVSRYQEQFKDKIIYLPCDSENSNFWKYFKDNYDAFGLKKVIATHYGGYKIWIDELGIHKEDLIGDGDFRSQECVDILKECDIVITNPPFSLFRDFIKLMMEHNKKFLVIGSQNAFTYKDIFPLIKENKLWTGCNKVKTFIQPDGTIKKFGNICWFSNMAVCKPDAELVLTKTYNPTDYPKYDNCDAINVDKVADIPKDYFGAMGVPITFLDKYNPNQFEILNCSAFSEPEAFGCGGCYVNNKKAYARVMIKRKTNGDE